MHLAAVLISLHQRLFLGRSAASLTPLTRISGGPCTASPLAIFKSMRRCFSASLSSSAAPLVDDLLFVIFLDLTAQARDQIVDFSVRHVSKAIVDPIFFRDQRAVELREIGRFLARHHSQCRLASR